MSLTLRQSLFRLLFGSIVVTAVVILLNVWTDTSKMVDEQIEHSLDVAKNVFQRVQHDKRQELINYAYFQAVDFAFIKAVKDGDIPTIDSALRNLQGRVKVDLLALIDTQGITKTSQPELLAKDSPFSYKSWVDAAKSGVGEGIGVVENKLYQMILLPIRPTVRSKTIMGFLLVGLELDDDFFKSFKDIVRADLIAFTSTRVGDSGDAQKHINIEVVASTLPLESSAKLLVRPKQDINWIDVTFRDTKPFVVRKLQLEAGSNLTVAVATDVERQYHRFTLLQVSIITISIIAILVSLGIALMISRRITEPLSMLIEGVKRIAAGDYGQSLSVSGRMQEIRHLGKAFSTMQESIASREKRIRYQAQHDDLTGLYNRTQIQKVINKKIEQNAHVQVIGLNIIGFRQINDLYGHLNGDICLQRIAERLTRWPGDAARLSGSDIIWLPESPLDEVKLETLKYILEQPVETDELSIPIKICMGLMDLPNDAENAEMLFRRMNIVIDEASKRQQCVVQYDDEVEALYLRRLEIITELKRALVTEQSELSVAYQPKICLMQHKVKGLEALIRWHSSTLGFVPPDEFIGVAEQAGLIESVTEWVIGQVIHDLSHLRALGHSVNVAINFSTQDIENKVLLTRFMEMLDANGLSNNDVQLEVTESDLVADEVAAMDNLKELRSNGFHIAIDDFGTGYSSLAYLKNLPVDIIKIDKSFVLNLAQNRDDQQIVTTVLKLAKAFDLKVVAEGIEDEVAYSLLTEWGCDYAQGYFISRPLKYQDLIEWFETTNYS